MGTAIAAGVGGAALGLLGGMIVTDMIGDAFEPGVGDRAAGALDDQGVFAGFAGGGDFDR